MKFRSEITYKEQVKLIDYSSQMVLLGSCFSEHIEKKFGYFKFNSLSNPFGILFNPIAIEKAISQCVNKRQYTDRDLMKHNEAWLSLDHHSSFNHRNPETILKHINENITLGHQAILNASHIFITLGTSWVYKWKEDDRIAGNCHKIPQKHFRKELLGLKEIISSLRSIIKLIRSINSEAVFVFTVSPVRHLKDGFTENTLSKSLLHTAIHELKKEIDVSYFPAYEIMMDDLRDYRFYKSDLLHPNDMAVDYIWEIFKTSWISEDAKKIMADIDAIQKSLEHRAFDPETVAHKKFVEKTDEKIKRLEQKYTSIKFHKKRK